MDEPVSDSLGYRKCMCPVTRVRAFCRQNVKTKVHCRPRDCRYQLDSFCVLLAHFYKRTSVKCLTNDNASKVFTYFCLIIDKKFIFIMISIKFRPQSPRNLIVNFVQINYTESYLGITLILC